MLCRNLIIQGHTVLIDECDYELVSSKTWHVVLDSGNYYARTNVNRVSVPLHRFILGVTNPCILVDHRNHKTLDCRRKNLRLCDHSQNSQNRSKTKQPTVSKYKGLSFDPKGKRPWMAQLICRGKRIYLGVHSTEIEAAKAYDEGAKKYFGEFACLNFGE